jgi:hypothetical protein
MVAWTRAVMGHDSWAKMINKTDNDVLSAFHNIRKCDFARVDII